MSKEKWTRDPGPKGTKDERDPRTKGTQGPGTYCPPLRLTSGWSGGSQLPSWQIHPRPGADPAHAVGVDGAGGGFRANGWSGGSQFPD